MYTTTNFSTKKALKEAVAAGDAVTVFQPNADIFGKDPYAQTTGTVYLEGPHYPQPHRWYAQATISEGAIEKGSIR